MDLNKDGKAYVDLDTGLNRVRNNKKLYSRMLGLFLNGSEFAALEDALAANDRAKAAEMAHAIKGMTGNLGMDAVFTASEALMVQLRRDASDGDTDLLAQYRSDLAETRRVVEGLLPSLQE